MYYAISYFTVYAFTLLVKNHCNSLTFNYINILNAGHSNKQDLIFSKWLPCVRISYQSSPQTTHEILFLVSCIGGAQRSSICHPSCRTKIQIWGDRLQSALLPLVYCLSIDWASCSHQRWMWYSPSGNGCEITHFLLRHYYILIGLS